MKQRQSVFTKVSPRFELPKPQVPRLPNEDLDPESFSYDYESEEEEESQPSRLCEELDLEVENQILSQISKQEQPSRIRRPPSVPRLDIVKDSAKLAKQVAANKQRRLQQAMLESKKIHLNEQVGLHNNKIIVNIDKSRNNYFIGHKTADQQSRDPPAFGGPTVQLKSNLRPKQGRLKGFLTKILVCKGSQSRQPYQNQIATEVSLNSYDINSRNVLKGQGFSSEGHLSNLSEGVSAQKGKLPFERSQSEVHLNNSQPLLQARGRPLPQLKQNKPNITNLNSTFAAEQQAKSPENKNMFLSCFFGKRRKSQEQTGSRTGLMGLQRAQSQKMEQSSTSNNSQLTAPALKLDDRSKFQVTGSQFGTQYIEEQKADNRPKIFKSKPKIPPIQTVSGKHKGERKLAGPEILFSTSGGNQSRNKYIPNSFTSQVKRGSNLFDMPVEKINEYRDPKQNSPQIKKPARQSSVSSGSTVSRKTLSKIKEVAEENETKPLRIPLKETPLLAIKEPMEEPMKESAKVKRSEPILKARQEQQNEAQKHQGRQASDPFPKPIYSHVLPPVPPPVHPVQPIKPPLDQIYNDEFVASKTKHKSLLSDSAGSESQEVSGDPINFNKNDGSLIEQRTASISHCDDEEPHKLVRQPSPMMDAEPILSSVKRKQLKWTYEDSPQIKDSNKKTRESAVSKSTQSQNWMEDSLRKGGESEGAMIMIEDQDLETVQIEASDSLMKKSPNIDDLIQAEASVILNSKSSYTSSKSESVKFIDDKGKEDPFFPDSTFLSERGGDSKEVDQELSNIEIEEVDSPSPKKGVVHLVESSAGSNKISLRSNPGAHEAILIEQEESIFGKNSNEAEGEERVIVKPASLLSSKQSRLHHEGDNEEDFRHFLEENLNFSKHLPINANYSPGHQLLKAYEYFEGVDDVIHQFFDVDGGEISDVQYQLVFQAICSYSEGLKRQHHSLLLRILSYLTMNELIIKVSRLNRKLYIVSGDLNLLNQYYDLKQIQMLKQAPVAPLNRTRDIIRQQDLLRKKKEEAEQQEKRAGAFRIYTFNDNETILSFNPEQQQDSSKAQQVKESARLFSLQQADKESTSTALWVTKQASDEEVKQQQQHLLSRENSREASLKASLVATPSYSPSKASGGTAAYEDFEGKNYYQFFRQSLRSSIGSKIKYNVKSNYSYVRQLQIGSAAAAGKNPSEVEKARRDLQFDIIADKPSKVILQLDQYFDVDLNQQVGEIHNTKKESLRQSQQSQETASLPQKPQRARVLSNDLKIQTENPYGLQSKLRKSKHSDLQQSSLGSSQGHKKRIGSKVSIGSCKNGSQQNILIEESISLKRNSRNAKDLSSSLDYQNGMAFKELRASKNSEQIGLAQVQSDIDLKDLDPYQCESNSSLKPSLLSKPPLAASSSLRFKK